MVSEEEEEEVHPDEGGQQTDAGKPGCIAPHAPAQVTFLSLGKAPCIHNTNVAPLTSRDAT